ncbi:MAG: hypothetical protein NZ890_09640 [Myxococcota bacterium]|nr:hypothetical protein [Myxococcota bacterium]
MVKHIRKHDLRIRLNEFTLPPIQDGLVLGRLSPIGHVAVGKALSLLSSTAFTHIPIEDEVIADVLVRSAILRKLTEDEVRRFVLEEVKPLMGPEEILHMRLEVDIILEDKAA